CGWERAGDTSTKTGRWSSTRSSIMRGPSRRRWRRYRSVRPGATSTTTERWFGVQAYENHDAKDAIGLEVSACSVEGSGDHPPWSRDCGSGRSRDGRRRGAGDRAQSGVEPAVLPLHCLFGSREERKDLVQQADVKGVEEVAGGPGHPHLSACRSDLVVTGD